MGGGGDQCIWYSTQMQKTKTTTRAKKENVESILTFRNTYDFKSNTKELAKKDITFIIILY